MRIKVGIVKLAAIGDVALACRALREFHERYGADLEIHWVIDRSLAGLARALLGEGLHVQWHEIDAARLFRGRPLDKADQALAMVKALFRAGVRHLLLLHRDWRYRLLLQPICRSLLISVNRSRMPELHAYRDALERLAKRLGLKALPGKPQPAKGRNATDRIGVLIGGAQSQKVTFLEKRWPKMTEVVANILEKSPSKRVVLFGGPEDLSLAQELLSKLSPAQTARIENLVGKLQLSQVPDALAELDAFVSIDSGLAHIASFVMRSPGQRVLALFGPTDPHVWGPRAAGAGTCTVLYKAVACSPCYLDSGDFPTCKYTGERFQHCMTEITPAEVLRHLF